MNKGFSLVELIVVIAIMAILVGVAVPVYTSYIKEAEDGVDAQYVDELERAINTVLIDIEAELSESDVAKANNTDPDDITSVKVEDGKVYLNNSPTESTESNSVFVDLLYDVIKPEGTYTFTISNNTVTTVNPDPRA